VAVSSRARKKRGRGRRRKSVCDLDRWVAVLEEPTRRGKRITHHITGRLGRRGKARDKPPRSVQEPVAREEDTAAVKENMRLTIAHGD
jgi:hypothetical protein